MSIRNVVLAVVVIVTVSLAIAIVSLLYYFVYQKTTDLTLSIHFVQNLRKLFPVIFRDYQEVRAVEYPRRAGCFETGRHKGA